jgi:hypothetical protein
MSYGRDQRYDPIRKFMIDNIHNDKGASSILITELEKYKTTMDQIKHVEAVFNDEFIDTTDKRETIKQTHNLFFSSAPSPTTNMNNRFWKSMFTVKTSMEEEQCLAYQVELVRFFSDGIDNLLNEYYFDFTNSSLFIQSMCQYTEEPLSMNIINFVAVSMIVCRNIKYDDKVKAWDFLRQEDTDKKMKSFYDITPTEIQKQSFYQRLSFVERE